MRNIYKERGKKVQKTTNDKQRFKTTGKGHKIMQNLWEAQLDMDLARQGHFAPRSSLFHKAALEGSLGQMHYKVLF